MPDRPLSSPRERVLARLDELQAYGSPYRNPSAEDLAWKKALGKALKIVMEELPDAK